MTAPTFTCDDFDAVLADRLEGGLSPDVRARADAHERGCARCAALVADLEGIMTDARALPARTPSRDLWPSIAERIAPRVLELPARLSDAAPSRQPAAWTRWAAAAALVAVSVGGTWGVMQWRAGAAPDAATIAAIPGQPTGPRPITVNRPSAEATLAGEVAGLEQALAQRERELDPKTVTVIQQSLAIIDRAIADARAALAADPSNPLLDQQLTRVLGKKVELMRRAAVLPART